MCDIKQELVHLLKDSLEFDQTALNLKEIDHPLIKEIIETLDYVKPYYLIKNNFLGSIIVNDYDIEMGRYCNFRKIKYKIKHRPEEFIEQGVTHTLIIDDKLITGYLVDEEVIMLPVPLVEGYRSPEKMAEHIIIIHKFLTNHYESVVNTLVEGILELRQANLKHQRSLRKF